MDPFIQLSSKTMPLRQENIDTDLIIPAAFLKTITRVGLGKGCFYTLRFDENGAPRNSNPFDAAAYRGAQILLAGDNFGCGSSREHAVWALMDLGFRCIIAPSFADIFANNALKNGMLLICLPETDIDRLEKVARQGQKIGIDLEAQNIRISADTVLDFEIEPFRKERLLKGVDEISLTMQGMEKIKAFEADDRQIRPWLYRAVAGPAL